MIDIEACHAIAVEKGLQAYASAFSALKKAQFDEKYDIGGTGTIYSYKFYLSRLRLGNIWRNYAHKLERRHNDSLSSEGSR